MHSSILPPSDNKDMIMNMEEMFLSILKSLNTVNADLKKRNVILTTAGNPIELTLKVNLLNAVRIENEIVIHVKYT